jgi:hypothetical protein
MISLLEKNIIAVDPSQHISRFENVYQLKFIASKIEAFQLNQW